MRVVRTESFKADAVRLALSSGRTREQVAKDLGVGKSTLGKWVAEHKETDLMAGPHDDLAKENNRLRLENRLLREEREVLKKAAIFFAKEKN